MINQTCVGRQDEFKKLHGFLELAASGQRQLCFVIGEAGSGKTTLLNSFIRSIEETDPDVVVAIGECNGQIGIMDPYLPFRDVITMLIGDFDAKLTQNRISPQNAKRLTNFVETSLEALLEYGPDLIGNLIPGGILVTIATKILTKKAKLLDKLKKKLDSNKLSIDDINEPRIFQQYTNVIRALTSNNTLVIVLDDLHWADNASINLLFHLLRKIELSRLFIVGTYRPDDVALGRNGGRHPLESTLNEIKRYFGDVWMELGKKNETEGQKFVDEIVDTEANRLSSSFRETLFSWTEGNALFTVEILRNMQERGDLIRDNDGYWIEGPQLNWNNLPPRVEGVIEERIMRLEEQLREALSIASVEGENFTAQVIGALQKINERQVLKSLSSELEKRHHLIQESGEVKVGPQMLSLYRFSHSLVQQYIYNDLGISERRLLHREVAEILESLYEGRKDEIATQLARHHQEAGQPEKAIVYFGQVGDKALRISAFHEAISLFEKALNLGTSTVEMQAILNRQLGLANYGLGEFGAAREQFGKSVKLARSINDLSNVAVGISYLGRVLADLGESPQAKRMLTEGLEIARSIGDKGILISALNGMGYVMCELGEFLEAQNLYKEGMSLVREMGAQISPNTLYDLGCCIHLIADFTRAKDVLKDGLDVAKVAGNLSVMSYIINELGWIVYEEKDFTQAQQYFEEGHVLAKENDDKWTMAEAFNGLGFVACALGNYSASEQFFCDALKISHQTNYVPEQLFILVGFSNLLAKWGKIEKAVELIALSIFHSGSNAEVKHFANFILGEMQSVLSSDVLETLLERGKSLDLPITVNKILEGNYL